MKPIFPDLWQSPTEHPFGNRTTTHAYLLLQPGGNVLFYGMSADDDDLEQIEQLGGISRQYLSHRHEAGRGLAIIKKRFGSLLCCHQLDTHSVRSACPVDLEVSQQEIHLGNIEIISTPGHTEGSLCFVVASSTGRKYLFTGDSIYADDNDWGTYVSRGQRKTLAKSLELLRDAQPDVVMSSASVGPNAVCEMVPGQWENIIDATIRSLT